jgi:pyrimidine-nucleoside phosphorylase
VTASIPELIARKRDGGELSRAELERMISPEVPEPQLAAFLMAVVWRGMGETETADLVEVMVESGDRLSWPWPVADKHSTGGVGDKTTLVVAPLVAACGVLVAKMSGRGLGHTGGTLDKLESIPGMRIELSPAGMRRQVEQVGIAVAGQSAELAPADGRLYALRDVTGTVPSIPLIASSIMSKKIASGATRLVLDVKVGHGAFMAGLDSARELAATMIAVGRAHDMDVRALLTDMNEPLGRAIGNALEVDEAVATLRGEGPADLTELATDLATELVGDRGRVERALRNGDAYETYRRWIAAQHGDPDAELPQAPMIEQVGAPRSGVITTCHARAVGDVAMALGAGRAVKGAPIDHAVGLVLERKVGDRVEAGEPLATVHARGEVPVERVQACFEIGEEAGPSAPLVLERVDA